MKKFILLLFLFSTGTLLSQNSDDLLDELLSPRRRERIITVGGTRADISGFDNNAIQTAVDALPPEGGLVILNPGIFIMKAPVRMKTNTRITGAGSETILRRIDGYHSRFIDDADYGELKVVVEDPSGFETGMSIQITNKKNNACWDATLATITDIVGNTLYIDNHLIRDYRCDDNGMVSNTGSCIIIRDAQNINISNLTVDGNKEKNDPLTGCFGGGISIIRSKYITIENVRIKNVNGEGITWQITEEVTVRNSEVSGCSGNGLHPGTGSLKSVIEGNDCHDNGIGLFLCWRVQHSIVKNNKLHNNIDSGISTGHKDSDVLFEGNHVCENGLYGIVLRNENDKNSPHRSTFINNTIENNGTTSGEGVGFFIGGKARDLIIENNIIRDNKKGNQKAAIFISEGSLPPVVEKNNKMSGHSLGNIIHEK